ncbi:HAMP domain-containing sensor histidine kinase [Deminuibacter soli]|uniref:histidine kinase n=1 Tax=Deminuibacter soli TaxID=2291815 RepID=A0A3E1NL50_9BACT|nr:HAMP domain-containing sensor histidine kinase [Deminuibacter soli]RFM28642.1 sensor histidine kinase [Deminuibacter soli]
MNLKFKFALLFSLLVFVILTASVSLIYILFADNRHNDFSKRLWAKDVQQYQAYYHTNSFDSALFPDTDRIAARQFFALHTVIVDSSMRVIYANPETLHYTIDTNFLRSIRSHGVFNFSEDKREGVGVFINEDHHPAYVISSALDKYGLLRLGRLRIYAALVLLGSIIITVIFVTLFVGQLTRPLLKLGEQMQRVTESNLRERVDVKNDYSELSGIASNFNDMLDRLQKGFEFQKSFVHHASHELRTPLASMLSQTEAALRRELTAEEARGVLQSLKEDQQELIELTNSLLLLSQYEQVSYSLDWPKVRLDEILYDTIEMVKRMFQGITISLEFTHVPENELYLSIRGNDALLRSAFRNLIRNAFQYSDNKNVQLIIEADHDVIKLHFLNRGKVLSRPEQERLFIPFFRGENAMKKRGFGLGLSIVRRIVLLHKGQVTYSNNTGNENCFTVSFHKTA